MKRVFNFIVKIFAYLVIFAFAIVFAALVIFGFSTQYRESQERKDVAPASGRFIQTNDAEIFVQESGPLYGQPVLLVHGTGSWSEIWRETIDVLGDNGFRVIAIDVPPFGYSEKLSGAESYTREKQAARIIDVISALDFDKVTIVGHSVGSRAVMEAVLTHPEKFDKLVLVDPALGFGPEGSTQFQQNNPPVFVRSIFAMKPLRNLLLSTYGTNPLSIKTLFSSFVSNKAAVTDERLEMLKKPLVLKGLTSSQADWLEYLLVSQDNSESTHFENLFESLPPTFLIWGSSDTVTPLWQGEALTKLIKDSVLVTIPDVGHIPYIENVDAFNTALLDILHSTSK